MELLIEPGRYSVCRLDPGRPWPIPPSGSRLYSVTRTAEELSVVCAEGHEPEAARVEPGWRALGIVGPLEFDLVGVIASVTVPLAASGIGVFVLSTYDTDLVLVKGDDLQVTVDALTGAGHRVGAADA